MRKLFYLLMLFAALFGCKQEKDGNGVDTGSEKEFNYQKLPQKISINPEALTEVQEWEEFQAFNESIDVLYKATNNEDLILAVDDLIEKEKLLSQGDYPEIFNTLQIKSRQRVIRTYLLKVKSNILEYQETTSPTVDMIKAYNAWRAQLNNIVNSQLDKKLILDEE